MTYDNGQDRYESVIARLKSGWPDHAFDLQPFDSCKPPERGYYDIMYDEDGELRYTTAYYSQRFDSWVLYPYWVDDVIYWDKNHLCDDDDTYETANNEDEDLREELFDFLDFKAGFASGEYNFEEEKHFLDKTDYYERCLTKNI